MNIKEIAIKTTTTITSFAGKTGLKISKHSPEILAIAGTTSIVVGVVLCCKATLKAEEVLGRHEEEMEVLEGAKEVAAKNPSVQYDDTDARRDTAIVYVHTIGRFAKLYAPGVGFTILGIGCFLGSYGIMKKRNVALMAAYKTLETAFGDYRKRVVEELGADKDFHFMHGTEGSCVDASAVDSEGTDPKLPTLPNGKVPSCYSRFFDETSTEWTRSPETNKMILTARQNWANDLLNSRGYVFLNEVYSMLGLELSQAGQAVGWVKNNPRGGDNFIDFGMYNVYRGVSDEPMRKFHNGVEYSILLDFNVDGVIWDLI